MKKTAKKPTFRALAALYKVHEKTVSGWAKAGIDVFDPDAVVDHTGGGQKNSAPNNRDSTLRELRAEKLRAEIDRLKFAHQKERGEFIDAQQAARDWIAVTSNLRGQILGFVDNDIPAMAGLEAVEMHRKGREWFASLCDTMSRDPLGVTLKEVQA